jgi:hypothetical protein
MTAPIDEHTDEQTQDATIETMQQEILELKATVEILTADVEAKEKLNNELTHANMRLQMLLIIHTKTSEHIRTTIEKATDQARKIEAQIPKDL